MRVLSLNIQHGGSRRVPRIASFVVQQEPDVAVIPEFRHNEYGVTLKERLAKCGLQHQIAPLADPRTNTVLVASRQPLAPIALTLDADDAIRCVAAAVDGIAILGVYFAQNVHKASLFDFLIDSELLHVPALIIGDVNTGLHRIDEIGATFFCTAEFQRLLDRGWSDTFRHIHGDTREYSWYSPRGNPYRIDHAFASPALLPRLTHTSYLHAARELRITDHSALIVELT